MIFVSSVLININMNNQRLLLLLLPFISLQFQGNSQTRGEDDFSFNTGSCAWIEHGFENKSETYYMGDVSIFNTMAHTQADFLLWLGDNWYYEPHEYSSKEGLEGKLIYTRTAKLMQPILRLKIPQYATWDDHDYGPDQSTKCYPHKEESRRLFMQAWPDNPSFGEDNEGIYTSFRKEDVQFILLDDRWWRERDDRWEYRWFIINKQKKMFGDKQMAWLKRKLLEDSTASFHIIANGSQMLNPWAKLDCFAHFPVEYRELKDFIKDHKIPGVIFISGDTHHSEIIKLERKNHYPLYDITVSPLTSSIEPPLGREKDNKYRVPGTLIADNNFARFSFSGPASDRKLKIEFFNKRGRMFYDWEITRKDLEYHKRDQ
jgi:alkaline phosphatase D